MNTILRFLRRFYKTGSPHVGYAGELTDGARLWLHADGVLIARIYRIGRLVIDDRRTKSEDRNER